MSFLGITYQHEPLGKGVYSAPSWSPTGEYFAFTFSMSGGEDNLWLFETQSNNYRKLYDEETVDWYSGLTWQDDHTLWFVSGLSRYTLHSVDVISGQVEDIINTGSLHGFTFYPDQNHILFAQGIQLLRFYRQDLFSLDLTSLSVTQITDTADIRETGPLASPDKQQIAFGGSRNGAEVSDQNGDAYFVAQVYSDVGRYTWSPDGKWFLYVDNPEPGIYLTSSDGKGTPTKIANDDAYNISWSSDGMYIAYTTVGVPGSNELHLVSAEELGLTLPMATPEA